MSSKSKKLFSFPGGIEIHSIPRNYVIKWSNDYQTYYGTLQSALEDICEFERRKELERATDAEACKTATELVKILNSFEKRMHKVIKDVGKQCEERCGYVEK